MENALLILAATIWRLTSYIFRAGVIGLSVLYGEGLVYHLSLFSTITIFFMLLFFTLKISEMNAMGQPAHPNLLITCGVLDTTLWIMTLLTLGVGLFNVTVF